MTPDELAAIEARANAVSRDRMGMSDPAGDWMICTHASQQDVPALVAEVRRLQAALVDAHDGMDDMISYVPAFFREKWEHDAYLVRARQALLAAGIEVPS